MRPIRVLVVDDHPIVRQGIQSLLSNYATFEVVAEAEDGRSALHALEQQQPDITLLDISLPGESGLAVLEQIRQRQPEAKVLMLTSYDDEEYVMGALKAGAQGFILKNVSDEMLVNAIQAAHRGERVLSPQVTEQVVRRFLTHPQAAISLEQQLDAEDRQILRLLTEGASNSDIADALYMSSATVKRKLSHIFKVMNVQTRTQAAAEAVRQGLV
jgi:DNA-binding NarL/FixJ family response regulator